MQAIILAAGMGKRLGELTQNNTKCMVKVNNITLIDRLLSQLNELGIPKVVIVVGYEGKKLINYIGNRYESLHIEYIENPIFNKTNNIYSLYLAKDELIKDDTLLFESDLIFEDKVVKKLMDNPYPDLALVDKYESWMDGTVVTIDNNCNISGFLGKDEFQYADIQNYYKTVNIYKFSKNFSMTHYVPFLEAYCMALGNNEYYEQVLRVITLLDHQSIKALPLTGEKWYEIDDVQDLNIAESIFTGSDDEHLKKINARYGGFWRYPKMLDFCYLVNPYFPNQKMLDEIKANFETLISEYPSGMSVNSLLIAKYFGINQKYVCAGNGAAELIKSLMEKFIIGKTGVVFPTFEEYPNRKSEVELIKYVPQNSNFSYTAEDLKSYFGDKQISNLLLINPDNPSGNYIKFIELVSLIEWTKKRKIRIIVDESFVDFSENHEQNTLLRNDILAKFDNLIVVKSISKSYGVPGLRLGLLAAGNIDMIQQIKKDVAIWNINSFAEFYLQIFGKYENDYLRACDKFIEERKRFYRLLQTVPYLRVIPSQANYFLCEVIKRFSSNELATLLLKNHEFLIKDCGTKKAFANGNYVRIAIRNTEDNDVLINALKIL